MAKNIEINYNNGTSYDALYPKTIASQVGAGTFSGSFTFGSVPSCSVSPTANVHLANKLYVDDKVAGITVTESSVIKVYEFTGTGSKTIRIAIDSLTGLTPKAMKVFGSDFYYNNTSKTGVFFYNWAMLKTTETYMSMYYYDYSDVIVSETTVIYNGLSRVTISTDSSSSLYVNGNTFMALIVYN